MKKKNKGFTLIELMVVIAIIGLLSSVVLAAITNARQKAENSGTVQTVRQLQNQLAIYNLDNGGYPNPTGTAGAFYCVGVGATASCSGPGGITVTNSIAMNPVEEKNSFFTLGAKEAFASEYPVGFANFRTLPKYLVYGCAQAGYVCSEDNAAIWYPVQVSGSIVWYSIAVTGTPSSYGY